MVSSEAAMDMARRGAHVAVYSGVLGPQKHLMAKGEVIGYCPAPSLLLRHVDGSRSSWSCDLPIEEIPSNAPRSWQQAIDIVIRKSRQEPNERFRVFKASGDWLVARVMTTAASRKA